MKILIVAESHFKEYGGPFTAINQKIEYFNNKNIKTKLIFNKTNFYKFNLDLHFVINDYDIVHIYGMWRPFLIRVYLLAKKLKKKIIISPIGYLEPWSLSQKKIKKKIAWFFYQKKIIDNVDLIHATSDIEAKNLANLKVKSKIKIIGHGIKLNENFKLKIKKNKIKKIIFFSRIHNKKGLLELIEVWKNLKNNEEWKLEIFGPVSDSNYFKKIESKIKDLKLEKNIFYSGAVFSEFKKKKIFEYADGFILPSKSENFGISIGEALSYGLPVLTTFETPWKIINEYKAGVVFNFSKQAIESSLSKFINLSDLERYEMGNRALELIKNNFSAKNIFKKYETMYKELINESFVSIKD